MANDEFKPLRHEKRYQAIENAYREEEPTSVRRLLSMATLSEPLKQIIQDDATLLMDGLKTRNIQGGLDLLLSQYSLSSEEGLALMCLAESLLRVPDVSTQNRLIRDKLVKGDWKAFTGKSPSTLVNLATKALNLTRKFIDATKPPTDGSYSSLLTKLLNKGGEPIVREAVKSAMGLLGRHFVLGTSMEQALDRAKKKEEQGYRYSYDRLGEAAFTDEDATRYYEAYLDAIEKIAPLTREKGFIEGPGISVKLSALHPRYSMAKQARLQEELYPRLKNLVIAAKNANMGFTIDAEESVTLMISLKLVERLFKEKVLTGWAGFGLAVQAYQKRAPFVIDWLLDLARTYKQPFTLRLVKGAYWDTEIKAAQVEGLVEYPVFTRKATTDLSYIACAKKCLDATDIVYPQFATHNALTLATIRNMAIEKGVTHFEFQCLHGMGDALYDPLLEHQEVACRIYAPVGSHDELLPYLVRRILENGANSSFVNQIALPSRAVDKLTTLPEDIIDNLPSIENPHIPLPRALYGPKRENSLGVDLSHPPEFVPILDAAQKAAKGLFQAAPSICGDTVTGEAVKRYSPIDRSALGNVFLADESLAKEAMIASEKAFHTSWRFVLASQRALYLEKTADLLQLHQNTFLSLLIYEGGKTLDDAVSEVREAIDFCRYYAEQARELFGEGNRMPGPTGETNTLSLHPRGVMLCISPWNFPLAIFMGQVTACLGAGNCVIAKPAMQTPLIAAQAVSLLHEAGFPRDVVQIVLGKSTEIGKVLVQAPAVQGVLLTGSTETACHINRELSARAGPIIPLIAETGGQNAMIVDSSALCEQVTQDVITSAFKSAGQRCSALRILFVQEDVADKMITMIKGAMAQLLIGDPIQIATDIGPVIDEEARAALHKHVQRMKKEATLVFECSLSPACEKGAFFAPCLFEIPSLSLLTQEVFGPILHVIRYKSEELDSVVQQINGTGYGLTLGIHSRIDETIAQITANAKVGNLYVNRNMIGAVVGVQPFGGEGLSGTGPKAGGPHYLPRLAHERTICVNTTAFGGNASLMSLSD